MRYLLGFLILFFAFPALAREEALQVGAAHCVMTYGEDGFPKQLDCKNGDKTVLSYSPQDIEPPPGGAEGTLLEAVDFNHDGAMDLKMLAWWGATGNVGYIWFLADPKTGLLTEAPQFADCQAELDAQGCCENFNKGGMVGMIYNREKLCLRGDKLITVWQEHQDWDEESKCFFKTTSTLTREGELKASEPEKICDPDWQ